MAVLRLYLRHVVLSAACLLLAFYVYVQANLAPSPHADSLHTGKGRMAGHEVLTSKSAEKGMAGREVLTSKSAEKGMAGREVLTSKSAEKGMAGREGLTSKSAEKEVAGWDRNRSRDMRLYVMPDNATTLLQPVWSCDEHTPYVLVIVCSAVKRAGSRAVIRDTWGSVHEVENASVRLAFLIGTPAPGSTADHLQAELDLESARYGDLIQENFVDTYTNLTLKTVFLLKWVRSYCAGARFILKTDDDVFVNVPSLVTLLQTVERGRAQVASNGGVVTYAGESFWPPLAPGPLLIGRLICHARPITISKHKWYAPKYMYSGREYPNYVTGPGYVLSSDAVAPLYSAALRTPFFHMEDVFLTGICAHEAGLQPRDHPAFIHAIRTPDACILGGQSVVIFHHMEQSTLRKVWAAIQQPSRNCNPAKVRVGVRGHAFKMCLS